MSEPLKVLRQVIVTELGIQDDRALIYNTKWTLPAGEGLFVLLSVLSSKPYSTGKWHEDAPNGLKEVQETAIREVTAIDIFSRSTEARDRRHEVLWALNSDTAQQACELNNLKIGDLPTSFVDISHVEASARLFRYQLTFNVHRLERREKFVQFFSDFTGSPDLLIEP